MASNATWEVVFRDGTETTVRAAGKRMARAKASVQEKKLSCEITSCTRIAGKAKNGNTPGRRRESFARRSSFNLDSLFA